LITVSREVDTKSLYKAVKVGLALALKPGETNFLILSTLEITLLAVY
jgi:hypothetical protein